MESRFQFIRDPHFKWGFLVFAVALMVRLVGIGWGLPNESRMESLHPDEPIVRQVSGNVNIAAGKFTPGFYNYGTLYLTMNSVGQKLADAYAPVDPQKAGFGPYVRRYYVVGRWISALAGAGLAWVIYAILRRRTNLLGAFLGSAAVAFAPGLVMHSRFQTVDMVATFLGMLGLHYALLLVPGRDCRLPLLGGEAPRGTRGDGEGGSAEPSPSDPSGATFPSQEGKALDPHPVPFGHRPLPASQGEASLSPSPREGEVRGRSKPGGGSSQEPPLQNPLPQGGEGALLPFWPTLIKAAICLGLSAGTKYTGGVLLVGLWGAIWFSGLPTPQRFKGLAASLGILLASLLVATPGILLDRATFLKDFTYELGHTSTGHGFVFTATPPGFIQQAVNLSQAFGVALILLGFVGLVVGAWRRHPWLIVMLASYMIFYLFIARAEVKFVRYCFPLIPILALGVGWLAGQCHQHPNRKWSLVVGLVAFALFGIPSGGIKDTFLYTGAMTAIDNRDAVGAEIKLAGQGKTVGLPNLPWFYSPTIYPAAQLSKPDYLRFGKKMLDDTQDPLVSAYDPAGGQSMNQWLESLEPDYVVYSTFEDLDMRRILNSKTVDQGAMTAAKQWDEFKQALAKDYDAKIWEMVSPLHDLMYVQPGMVLWTRRK